MEVRYQMARANDEGIGENLHDVLAHKLCGYC
jgi:hypothetical protein